MTKTTLLGFLALGGLAALGACDNGQDPTTAGLGANDCPFGTFRPAGLDECVFPANDLNNFPVGVSDNRCAFGQPANPPQCVSDSGERAYLSISTKCAPNYRFEPGVCNRIDNGGEAGSGPINTGAAGASVGAAGAAGGVPTGFGAIGGSDSAGTAGAAGAGTGEGGATGASTDAGGTG